LPAALAAFVRCEWREQRSDDDLAVRRPHVPSRLTIFVVLFAIYGMLLVTTQYLQNVRGHTPVITGPMLLPYSVAITIVSLVAGRLVGKVGARLPILVGLVVMVAGLATLVVGMQGFPPVTILGLALSGAGGALCLTPITSLAMSAVPPERAGMASGIMSAQRAIGSTVGFAVLARFSPRGSARRSTAISSPRSRTQPSAVTSWPT
jgi:MFS family permease